MAVIAPMPVVMPDSPLTNAELRASPVDVVETGSSSTLSNGSQTTVSSSAVQILAANTSRNVALVQNVGFSNIRVGITGVTATTGIRVKPDELLVLSPPFVPTAALFAIREGDSDSIAFATEIT